METIEILPVIFIKIRETFWREGNGFLRTPLYVIGDIYEIIFQDSFFKGFNIFV